MEASANPERGSPTPGPGKRIKRDKMPDTLTSAVYNEAELIFQILEHKDRKLISYLDCLTLLRGMGMNPTTKDMDELHATMKEPILELEAKLREEEEKREKERKAQEKKDPKKEKAEKEKAEKEKKEKEEKEKAEAEAAKDGNAPPKKKVSSDPAEEIKNINWPIFINHVEPIYRDNQTEVEEIIQALSVFDTTGKGYISKSTLIDAVTESGESVLSPAEVKQLKDAFPGDVIKFKEFAQRLQGIYQGPSPEELAAEAEAERRREEEAKKAAAAAAKDDLLGGLSVPGLGASGNPNPNAPSAEGSTNPAPPSA